MKKEKCDCKICVRHREFKKHIATIEDKEAKMFFENLFGYIYDVEEESEFLELYQRNLKMMYPQIYKEMHTVTPLTKGEEQFPEKNI